MKVDIDLVQNVAQLAQLTIPANELDSTINELNLILALADQMQEISTDDIEPMANPLDATQRLRRDAVTEENQRQLYQSNAPLVEQGYFLVPRVVE